MIRKCTALLLAAALLLANIPALAADGAILFTDSLGRQVEVAADIETLAPSGQLAQIFLFALAPERFVGLSNAWSPKAEAFLGDYYSLPVLGQLYNNADLNLEELAVLNPQVIIDVGEAKSGATEDLDALQAQTGIPAVHITTAGDSFAEAYRLAGSLLGLEERGEALAAYCEEIEARIDTIMAEVGENRVSLLYCMGDKGLAVIAKDSYHAEIIDKLASNAAVVEAPSSKGTGNEIDMEQLLLWDPDMILFAPDGLYEQATTDPLWESLQAIQSGSYAEVPFGPYNWLGFPPSVQRYLGMLWLCDMLYPEYTDYDLYDEAARYFDLFYHTELTQEQFDALTANAYPAK